MGLSTAEQLLYLTVRIETFDADGKALAYGTGFIYDLLQSNNDQIAPVIVTNKHVIKGATSFRILMCTIKDGIPQDQIHYPIIFSNITTNWLLHPEKDVDLAIVPLLPFVQEASSKGITLYHTMIGLNLMPDTNSIEEMDAIEEIVMIGYPNGLSDTINNKPIIRKGITATHYKNDYCGKKEFLIDCACFGGSSGSPVFIHHSGIYSKKDGSGMSGGKTVFLGILYAGPQVTAEGELKIVNIPTSQQTIVQSKVMMNLGVIIKAEKLQDFKQLLF